MDKRSIFILVLLLLPSVAALQQGHLEFELSEEWKINEQRSATQSFVRGDIFLDIRASDGNFIPPDEFAESIDGEVVSSRVIDEVNETVITFEDQVYILSFIVLEGEHYTLTGLAPVTERQRAEASIREVYQTLAYNPEARYIEASWEKELKKPGKLPFFVRHPIPWMKLFGLVIVALVLFLIVKRIRKKKKK